MKEDKLKWLRRWFVAHFVVDLIVAIPLMLTPATVLSFLKLDQGIVMARMVSAALLAIGGESFLGRKSNREGLLGRLRLKIIWSSMAILALGWAVADKELSLVTGSSLIGIFLVFNLLWLYWFLRLKKDQ